MSAVGPGDRTPDPDLSTASGETADRPAGLGARRAMTYAVLLCLAGAGLALFATTRTWAVEVVTRPAPLPAQREVYTGARLLPWLPALALVGLAGAGAVIATRGRLRRVLGGLVTLLGVLIAAGGGYGAAGPVTGEVHRGWPLLCLLGGVLAVGGGAWTAMAGQTWPAMGARYERPTVAPSGPPPAGTRPDGTRDVWDALDRGEDPTER